MRLAPIAPLFAAAAALAAPVAPAAAQSAGDAPIVVTGERITDDEIGAFVEALTPTPVGGQIARFETQICPAALGLPAEQRAAVEARIRLVADAVGLRVADAKCAANVVVMVTRDKKALLATLGKKYPDFFAGLTPTERKRIRDEPGPVAAWQAGAVVNADGQRLAVEEGVAVNRTTRVGSRITAAARPTFAAAAVVVEVAALEGLTPTQLADYVVMRSFARTEPAKLAAAAPATILRVMDAPAGTAVPITLTEWDYGFLRGLYAAPPNLAAPAQRSAIGRTLERQLGGDADAKDPPRP
ncbi:MAG: hypothetical protein ACREB7_12170 [Sphingopyxis sp.]|uniref:hypothetical protein n=1 Tax=Sphingopyxis sp. TaxID=1908224 RepID=UPI003D6D345E